MGLHITGLLWILLAFSPASELPASASYAPDNFFDIADSFFKNNISNGQVNYAGIKTNSEKLDELVRRIEQYETTRKPAREIKAFYINAYNILTIKGIVDHYPVQGPLKIEGFFSDITYNVAGEMLTLSQIENEKLRTMQKDPRIHFALVCAARGCPPIAALAYRPELLDGQLETQTQRALNNGNFIRTDVKAQTLRLSQIFQWYREDFPGSTNEDLRQYVNAYLDSPVPANSNVEFYTYDWNLNGQ